MNGFSTLTATTLQYMIGRLMMQKLLVQYTNWHVGGKAGVLETEAFVRNVLEEIRLAIFS